MERYVEEDATREHVTDTDKERTHSDRALNAEKERLQELNTARVVTSKFIST
jgi:hypothetical protein